MNTYISLLRGINVSGQKKIKMADLRQLYTDLGFAHVKSYLQSGNVVFQSPETDTVQLVSQIQAAIQAVYGFEVPVLIRKAADLQRIVETSPYRDQEDIKTLYVTFFNTPPAAERIAAIEAPENCKDEFTIGSDEALLYVPTGFGRTKINNNWFERNLKVTCTTRNWKTVNALIALGSE